MRRFRQPHNVPPEMAEDPGIDLVSFLVHSALDAARRIDGDDRLVPVGEPDIKTYTHEQARCPRGCNWLHYVTTINVEVDE